MKRSKRSQCNQLVVKVSSLFALPLEYPGVNLGALLCAEGSRNRRETHYCCGSCLSLDGQNTV